MHPTQSQYSPSEVSSVHMKTGRSKEVPSLQHRIGLALHNMVMRLPLSRPSTLFVLGTMRSGSSLMTNLLTSHDEIVGFGESHIIYDHPARLLDLRYWILRYTRKFPRANQYVMDKVLHTDYLPEPGVVLDGKNCAVLFLIRNPADTAASLIKMYEKVALDGDEVVDPWDLLTARYTDLAQQCQAVPPSVPMGAVSYESLVGDPDTTLSELSTFLKLSTPLTAKYDVPKWVGTWGIGDGSAAIKSGKISKEPKRAANDLVVPQATQAAFDAMLDVLRARCAMARI